MTTPLEADVLIVGGGPAGAACATHCARAGLRTVVLERSRFPREKVCGDCLNPNAWPTLEGLGVAETVLQAPLARLSQVEFIGPGEVRIRCAVDDPERPEIAIKRSVFDEILLRNAENAGAHVIEGESVVRVEPGWKVITSASEYRARVLVAADGRNSTVARLLGVLPPPSRDRVGMQVHIPIREEDAGRVQLRFLPDGYCGVAPVSDEEQNVCLVARPARMPALREWASGHFGIPQNASWKNITPIGRAPLRPAAENLYFIGDTARVVEPFTGEGIFYALSTGALAARHIADQRKPAEYIREQSALYKGRLWINYLAKMAVLHPSAAKLVLLAGQRYPSSLRWLTSKVTRV